MQPQLLNVLIAAVLTIGVAGIVLAQKNATPAPGTNATTTPGAMTLADVQAHNTRESCWSVINGNVYDLTSWIPEHPGGEAAILGLCGTDGSARFNGKHGGSATQENILAGFKIGSIEGGAQVAPSATPPTEDIEDDRGRNRGRGGDDND